ncbi:MAG: hypothetical protein FuTV1_gp4 [Hangzhou tombus-like virus 1]|nr:MAG: hypothetical protein FuTV1_gp4 [Hangzhou tombus-like virus 1]
MSVNIFLPNFLERWTGYGFIRVQTAVSLRGIDSIHDVVYDASQCLFNPVVSNKETDLRSCLIEAVGKPIGKDIDIALNFTALPDLKSRAVYLTLKMGANSAWISDGSGTLIQELEEAAVDIEPAVRQD